MKGEGAWQNTAGFTEAVREGRPVSSPATYLQNHSKPSKVMSAICNVSLSTKQMPNKQMVLGWKMERHVKTLLKGLQGGCLQFGHVSYEPHWQNMLFIPERQKLAPTLLPEKGQMRPSPSTILNIQRRL